MTEEKKMKLVDRIRKLLALSTSPNEHEAAVAMSKAQALLIEHNLSMTDVETESGGKGKRQFTMNGEKITVADAWMRSVAMAVAKLFFCEYFYTTKVRGNTRNDVHTFIGEAHNIAVCHEMFDYLVKTIRRLATQGAGQVPKEEFHKYRKSFYWAATGRIGQRVSERIAAMRRGDVRGSDGRNLPALASLHDEINSALKDFIKDAVGGLRTKAARATYSNALGARDGYKAGNSISLEGQIGGRKQDYAKLT